ncbi:MAG: hypothetical protein ACI9ON_000986 [Limisphaerales bacterium]
MISFSWRSLEFEHNDWRDNPEAKSTDRDQLAQDIEEFLSSGGAVKDVAGGERADPPEKLENNYGRGSI